MDDNRLKEIRKQLLQWGTNFDGQDLSHLNLSGLDFRMCSMIGVNLSGSNLTRANLAGANLTRANLTDADFEGADLNNANLSQVIVGRTNFRGAIYYLSTKWGNIDPKKTGAILKSLF